MLSRKDLVTTLTDTIVTNFFLEMLNPGNRSTRFQFSLFDIAGWVRSRLGINLPSPPADWELNLGSSRAREKWERLISQVGDGIPENVR
jgi:hypothetical protein